MSCNNWSYSSSLKKALPMKYLLFSLIFAFSTGLFAQDTQVNMYSSSLTIGERLEFGNRSLKFKNVISDSRCPKAVTCIWAGEAIIAVEVYEDGKCIEEKVISVTSSNIPLEFTAEDIIYNIAGLSLSPLPSVKKQNLPEEYRLIMRVSETIKI